MAEQTRDFLARSVLSVALTAAATSLTVADGSLFPSTGDFDVRIDDELITVASRSSNVLSGLTRAAGTPATTAASHILGSVVKMVLTKRSLDTLFSLNAAADQAYALSNLSFHMNDSTCAHVATQICLNDSGSYYPTDNVEMALTEVAQRLNIIAPPGSGGTVTAPVQLTQIQNINDSTVLANNLGAPAYPHALTVDQLRTLMQLQIGFNVASQNDTRFTQETIVAEAGTSHTLGSGDIAACIEFSNSSTGITLTFPQDSAAPIPVNSVGTFMVTSATGVVTFAAGAGATIQVQGGKTKTDGTQYGPCLWKKRSANIYVIQGFLA